MAVQSAGAKVAHTPELLEQILLDLIDDEARIGRMGRGVRNVFQIQAVSSAFRNNIAESSKIKQRLFMAAPSAIYTSTEQGMFNPLLWRELHIETPVGSLTLDWSCHEVNGWAVLEVDFYPEISAKVHNTAPEVSWRMMYLRKSRYKVGSIRIGGCSGYLVKLDKVNPTAGEIYDAAFASSQKVA